MFIRTESFQQFIKLYPAVSILLLVNIIMFLLSSLPIFPDFLILKKLAGFNHGIAAGEWWRLVTPIFLHGSFSHLLFNCFSMVILAPALETLLGRLKFCLFFMATGIVANIATYIINPLSFIHVGSSNAILGMLGFYLFMAVLHKKNMSRQNAITIYSLTALAVIMTFTRPETNLIGHLSGLAAGIALAPIFKKRSSENW